MRNYFEVYSFGRGAGTDKACTVAFEVAIKLCPVEENINVLQEKAGISIIYLPSGKRSVSGFITADKLFEVDDRIREGERLIFDREMHPQVSAQEPYVFKMGNQFKGKTPEQLLLEGMSEEVMLNQRNYLANNCVGDKEKKTLLDALQAEDSQFIAVYGRRRVGKMEKRYAQ